MMQRFCDALNSSELKEIKLSSRQFTWSNKQANPTLVRLDRAFCDLDWDLRFSNTRLQPLAMAMSDHCPLLLTCEDVPHISPCFHFEAFWTHIEGFKEVFSCTWEQPCPHLHALGRLDLKLKRTARALRFWQKNCMADRRLQLLMAQDTLLLLDAVQESRILEEDELQLHRDLKSWILGLSVIEGIKACQRSRVKWLRFGDAITPNSST